MREVHAVERRDERRGQEHRGDDGEDLDDLRLLDVERRHDRLLQVAHLVVLEPACCFTPSTSATRVSTSPASTGSESAISLRRCRAARERELGLLGSRHDLLGAVHARDRVLHVAHPDLPAARVDAARGLVDLVGHVLEQVARVGHDAVRRLVERVEQRVRDAVRRADEPRRAAHAGDRLVEDGVVPLRLGRHDDVGGQGEHDALVHDPVAVAPGRRHRQVDVRVRLPDAPSGGREVDAVLGRAGRGLRSPTATCTQRERRTRGSNRGAPSPCARACRSSPPRGGGQAGLRPGSEARGLGQHRRHHAPPAVKCAVRSAAQMNR